MVRNRSRSASSSTSSSRSVMLCFRDCTSIMIRMLVAGDGRHLLRAVILHRGLAWQGRDADDPSEPGLRAELAGRNHPVRPVEGAGHDLDARAVDAAEAERRAAIPAEITLGD